jgi:steroid delta-isomerase-like uncharacterized protein
MKDWHRIALAAALTAALGGLTIAGATANAEPSTETAAVSAVAAQFHNGESARVAADKRVVQAFIADVLNAHHGEHAGRYFTPDMQWHGGTVGDVTGRDSVAGLMSGLVTSIPDLHDSAQDVVAQGDKVVVRAVITGTQRGPLLGIPAGNQALRWDAVDVYQVRNGRISAEWAGEDFTAVLDGTGTYRAPWIQ